MNKEELKDSYANVCNEYLKAFCEKHEFNYKEAKDSWVRGVVGDACMIGDYCISFNDMKVDIDNDSDKEEFFKYYQYGLEASHIGYVAPNYENWLRGCPRLSEAQRKLIREAKNRVYEAQADLERTVKYEMSLLNGF